MSAHVAYCANDHTHGPAVGETTTGVRIMPELADVVGDGGLVEDVELLCAGCLHKGTG